MRDLHRRLARLEAVRPAIDAPRAVTGYIEPGESLPDAFARLRAGDPSASVLALTPGTEPRAAHDGSLPTSVAEFIAGAPPAGSIASVRDFV